MGVFSWKTSDTDRSIPCEGNPAEKEIFTVYMVTEDGQIFTEKEYQGYGEFGGKDIYVLIAEMNGQKGATDEESRDNFFNNIWLSGIQKDGKRLINRKDFQNYESPLEDYDGLTPNQLTKDKGWKSFGHDWELEDFAKQGLKVPKLFEEEYNTTPERWNSFGYPERCEFQGYFYDDDDERCDYCRCKIEVCECDD